MLKQFLITLLTVIIPITVFSFGEFETYINKVNPVITESDIYEITGSLINASQEYNFDPVLILAVMKVESDFNVYAYNSMDARGLMQIRVPVWFDVLKDEGLMFTWKDFYNPERNIYSGVYILNIYRNMCKKKNKGLKCILQRYNGDRLGSRYYTKVMTAVNEFHEMDINESIKLANLQ